MELVCPIPRSGRKLDWMECIRTIIIRQPIPVSTCADLYRRTRWSPWIPRLILAGTRHLMEAHMISRSTTWGHLPVPIEQEARDWADLHSDAIDRWTEVLASSCGQHPRRTRAWSLRHMPSPSIPQPRCHRFVACQLSEYDSAVEHPPSRGWAVCTANAYQFVYDDEVNCPSPLYTSGIMATMYHLPPAMGLGTWNWCAQSRDPAGNWSGWSASRTDHYPPTHPGQHLCSPYRRTLW